MNSAENLLQKLPQLSDQQLKSEYLSRSKLIELLGPILQQVTDKDQALRVVKLALEIDKKLGAKLAGAVKAEFQRQTVSLIAQLKIPTVSKIQLLGLTRSELMY